MTRVKERKNSSLSLRLKACLLSKKIKFCDVENSRFMQDFTLTVAQTEEDLKKAYALVYESYRSLGIVSENSHKLQMTKFNLLPTTVVVILKHNVNEEVVATMSIINDSPLGLPIEEFEDISEVRKKGRVAEAGALTIKESYRNKGGKVYFPLLQYTYQLARELFSVDYAVFMFHPKVQDFYRLILSAERVSDKIFTYTGGRGAPGLSMYAPVSVKELQKIQKDSCRLSFSKRLAQFLSQPSLFGDKMCDSSPFYSDYKNLPSPEVVQSLLSLYSDLSSEIKNEEVTQLQNVFFSGEYKKVLQLSNIFQYSNRHSPRLLSKCQGLAFFENGEEQIYTVNVSEKGLRFVSNCEFKIGVSASLVLKIGDGKRVMVDVKVLWSNSKGEYGACIESVHSPFWSQYIKYLMSCVDHSVQEVSNAPVSLVG